MLQNWSVANESGLYSKKGSGVFSFLEALNTINYPYSKTSLLPTKQEKRVETLFSCLCG